MRAGFSIVPAGIQCMVEGPRETVEWPAGAVWPSRERAVRDKIAAWTSGIVHSAANCAGVSNGNCR